MSRSRWPALAAAGVWVAGLLLLLPSLDSWLMGDDIRNWRWALEYAYEPWQALTQRHSVHDHIRPLTLMSVWAGLTASNGLYWGPQALLVALALLGLAAGMALAWEWGRRPWAPALAGLCILGQLGFQRLPDWQAWLCSAGEVGCGLAAVWALSRAARAARPGPWVGLCLTLGLCSGLYKEPGWVVWPATGAAVALGAAQGWRAAVSRGALAWLGLAALGFAYTWHPTNAFRYGEAPDPLTQRALGFLLSQPALAVDPAPFAALGGADLHALGPWAGVSALLLGPGLAGLALGRPGLVPGRRLGGVLGVGAALAAAFVLLPDLRGPVVLGAALALLAGQRLRPHPALVMALAGYGVMLPMPGPNEVQTLSGAVGLALAAALGVLALLEQRLLLPFAARLALGGVVGAGVAVEVEQLGRRLWAGDWDPEMRAGRRAEGERFVGYGAVAQKLDMRIARASGELWELDLAPMLALTVEAGRAPGAESTPAVALDGRLVFDGTPEQLIVRLAEGDLLGARPVPALSQAGHARRSELRGGPPRATLPSGQGLALAPHPGLYTLGGRVGQGVADDTLLLLAQDSCGRTWRVNAGQAPIVATAIWVRVGCESLRVARVEGGDAALEALFFSPLEPPFLGFRGLAPVERRLNLGVAQGGRVQEMFAP